MLQHKIINGYYIIGNKFVAIAVHTTNEEDSKEFKYVQMTETWRWPAIDLAVEWSAKRIEPRSDLLTQLDEDLLQGFPD